MLAATKSHSRSAAPTSRKETNLNASVVIPAFNAATTIEASILSALHQTVPVLDIVVGDDASTDSTVAVARAAGATVLELPKGNGAIARNRAAEAAKGDILFFLDADDLWEPTKVAKHLAIHEQLHPSIVLDRSVPFNPDGSLAHWRGGLNREGAMRWRDFLSHRAWPSGSGFSVSKENYWKVGGFNEKLTKFQDVDFWVRCAAHCGDAYNINEELTRYRLVAGSVSKTTKNQDENLRNLLEKWDFADKNDRNLFLQVANLMMAEQNRWPEALKYLSRAHWPIGNRFFWKCAIVSLKRTISSN